MIYPAARLNSHAVRLGAAFAAALLLLTMPARAEIRLEPAYPDTPQKGPAAAQGAVIWNHGIAGSLAAEAMNSPVPTFVAVFRDAGWDVFRALRTRQSEEPNHSTAAFVQIIERLKQEGYGKIIMAGQSGGAWLSLMAASRSDAVHAVIANAPAYYGVDREVFQKNSFILLDHIDDIRRGRIMISYFKDDNFAPGGRGAPSDALLTKHGLPHVVVDEPEGFSGHHGGNTALFRRRFGDCILAVAGDGPMPTREACDSGWGRAPSAELALPADLRMAAPQGGPVDPFLGKWYGYYGNGRELMLVIEHVSGNEVDAVYVIGPGPDNKLQAGTSRRRGVLSDGKLIFAKPGDSTLRYSLRPDGWLAAEWIAADEKSRLDTVLRPLAN
jgi:pimeloyl-ACP methyl ester carboxylesterase